MNVFHNSDNVTIYVEHKQKLDGWYSDWCKESHNVI